MGWNKAGVGVKKLQPSGVGSFSGNHVIPLERGAVEKPDLPKPTVD